MSPARPPKGPDAWNGPPRVVSLSDIARKMGKPRNRALETMARRDAPPGKQTARCMVWDEGDVDAYLATLEPRKGPQATCDRNHPMKESPSGRRYCPTCDVRRHKEKRQRDKVQQDEQGSAKP